MSINERSIDELHLNETLLAYLHASEQYICILSALIPNEMKSTFVDCI